MGFNAPSKQFRRFTISSEHIYSGSTTIMSSNKCNVCDEKAFQKCSRCCKVFYCSKEHQKSDWKQHKTECFPFKIASDDSLGRHLVATKDIAKYEIVLTEAPLIYGPAEHTIPVCLGCNQEISPSNYRLCSKCGWPMCSEACENAPCHVPECFYTAQSGKKINIDNFGKTNPFYQCVTVLRCLYQRDHNPDLWRKLCSLESHCDQRVATSKHYTDTLMAEQLIQTLLQLEHVFSLKEITRMCGVLMINAHEVPLAEPPYVAVYEKASMLENDCRSNCCKTFTNTGKLVICTGVDVTTGQNLSICYSDPFWTTPMRRNFLNETKFFWCSCERCSDRTEFGTYFSSVSCQNGGTIASSQCDGFVLPSTFLSPDDSDTTWHCNKCQFTVSDKLVGRLSDKITEETRLLDKSDVRACKSYLNKLRNILPGNSAHLLGTKLALCQSIGQTTGLWSVSDEDLDLKRALCRELARLTEVLMPSERRVRGLIVFELHAALVEIARRFSEKGLRIAEARELLEESRFRLTECMELLKHEPKLLPEGKVYEQARRNFHDLNKMLSQ